MNTKYSKKILSTTTVAAIIVLFAFTAMCTSASAATDEEVEQAIINGTAWLADAQQDDGSWGGGGWDIDYDIGATGLVLLKFIDYAKEQGYNPTDPEYAYSENVIKGLEFLDSHLMTDPVPVGGYDGNSNGNMIYLDGFHRTYVTGIALMAYAANPDTPADLVQDLTDWLVNAQCNDSANPQYGVWSYTGFSCGGDNSNTGYATLGIGYALNSGATIPATTTTALSSYVDYIQNDPEVADDGSEDDPDGGSGYTDPSSWVNSLKTGNLIYEAVLSGDAADSQRILNATDYIDRHWDDDVEGWIGNLSAPTPYNTQYQATYTIMKGLESIGLDDLNGKDWFDEISTAIVDEQLPDGNWTKCPNYVSGGGWAYIATDELCTAWALLTLEKITPLMPMTPGKVTGGGQIIAPVQTGGKKVDKASFGFNVMYREGDPAPKGELEYIDHATKMNVHAHDMTRLVVSNDKTQAWFEGTCTIDGVSGYTFEAYVEDNNEPGKNDVFEITLSTGYTAGGELLSGNIQIHKKP